MSSRSPKDASLGEPKMLGLLQDQLLAIPPNATETEKQNEEFVAFFRSQVQALKITSGA